ncbi:MAG: hypothetical protein KDB26_11835, partial [Microthrixaceae bacterium]|nr:hypothetical protein [Microthrixaceae bacterium]
MIKHRPTNPAAGLALTLCAVFCLSFLTPTSASAESSSSDVRQASVQSATTTSQAGESHGDTDGATTITVDEDDDQVRITTTLKVGGKPISGIEMIVSRDGAEVG